MKVKLHPSIDLPGQGFLDPAGQKIRAGHPKPGEKFQKGKVFEVEQTDFVIERIKTGELIVVEEKSSTPELGEKERKALFKEAPQAIDFLRNRIKNEDLSAEVRMAFDEAIAMFEKATKAEDVSSALAAKQKIEGLLEQIDSVKGSKVK